MTSLRKLYSVDFGLPFQGFYFDYKVTANRQIPILRELLLRLLKIGDTEVNEIKNFLGLNATETNSLVRMLVEDDEARITEEQKLQLTGKGLSYFKESIDDIPSVTQMSEYQDIVSFDQLTFEVIRSSGDQYVFGADISGLLVISADIEKLSKSIEHAKRSFVNDFYQTFHDLRKDDGSQPEHPHLYKVSNCEPRRKGYIKRSVDIMFDLDSRTVSEVWDSTPKTSWQEPIGRRQSELRQASNIDEVRDFFEHLDYVKGVYACGEPSFNAIKYITEDGREFNRPFKPFIGWISDQVEQITSVIASHEYTKLTFDWYVPEVSIWGKSDELKETVELLLNPENKKNRPSNRQINLHLPSDGSKNQGPVKQLQNRMKEFSKEIKVTKRSSDYRNNHIEVLLVNDFLVVVVAYLYRESEYWPIPVAFFSEDPQVIGSISRDIKHN